LLYYYRKMTREPKGPDAARWRKRKSDALRRYALPDNLLPGSLSQHRVRCGKPTCHCADGDGHVTWTLTYMADQRKRVLHIPHHLVDEVRRRVDAGRALQDALRDVLTANAELLILAWKEEKQKRRTNKARTPRR
jgi:hypothetical protein